MVRAPFYDKYGVKKGAWSPEEDEKLRAYIQRYGHWNWRELPKFAGLARCGKSCRLRWMNYLRPEVKHGSYTEEENETIIKLHEEFGNRWSLIASRLPGRTDNEIKNHWHTCLKKRAKRSRTASEAREQYSETSQCDAARPNSESEAESVISCTPPHPILESSPLSPASTSSSTEFSSLSSDHGSVADINFWVAEDSFPSPTITNTSGLASETYEENSGDFWTEPFVADNLYNPDGYSTSFARYDVLYDDTLVLFYRVMQELQEK